MIPGLVLALLIAVLDWLAVLKSWRKVEFVAKPAVMLALLGLLGLVGGFAALPLICFSIAIFFSLAGDVLLMFSYLRSSDRLFLVGLVAFLLAHLAYIVGLNTPLPQVSPIWSLALALVLALTAGRLIRRIMTGIRQKGLPRLERPVGLYGLVITLMLLSALLTLDNPAWQVSAAGLITAGAILFYFSDVILAWNRFVNPIRNGRLVNIVLYHLGQIALVAGILLQFAK